MRIVWGRRWLGLCVAVTLPLGAAQPPVFRGGVDIIVVEAHVADRNGTIAKGLTPADFQVTVGGRAREIVSRWRSNRRRSSAWPFCVSVRSLWRRSFRPGACTT